MNYAHHIHPLLLDGTVRECEVFLKLSGIEGYDCRNRLDSAGQAFWLTRNHYFDQGFWDGTWDEEFDTPRSKDAGILHSQTRR